MQAVFLSFFHTKKKAATAKTVDQVNAAIERVLKNIRTKAHTDYPTTPIKSLLPSIGSNLQGLNMIGIREPNRRDELVFVDIQIARSFPLDFSSINAANKIIIKFVPLFDVAKQIAINNAFNNAITTSSLITSLNVIPSIIQAFTGVSGTPSPEIQNSSCLLMALEANPDGLKGEFLGTAVTTDPVTKARYISTADGQPICFQVRYLDSQSGGSKSVVGTVTVELVVP